ncbi:MAG: peptidoglycan bridge formation glycyltransferase FemA/FemB family protein, partial [Patescibacteria group bacterium]
VEDTSFRSHLLQSDDWMRFQELLGRQTFQASGSGWSYSAILEKSEPFLGKSSKRLYTPYGPIAGNAESLSQAIISLKKLAVTHKASYVRVEPYPYFDKQVLKKLSLHKNLRNSQPDLTWVLDLRPSEDELLMNMTSLNRRVWRRYKEFGLSFEEDSSAEGQKDFDKLMNTTANRTSSIFHDKDYIAKLLSVFGKSAGIVFCLHTGKRLAGALFVDDLRTKTRYYMYACSVEQAKKHSCSSALLNFLIFNAKNSGIERFDFFGVSSSSETKHPWAGYSAFKRSFGGSDVRFSGTWELPVKELSHSVTRLGRRAIKILKTNRK